tara:strand:+ start:136 stop:525 length:390 start_codon:yes stop_codon:yes gene_type:complete
MDIKKIIKEEINDFEWASGVKPSTGKDVTTSGMNLRLTDEQVKYLLDKENLPFNGGGKLIKYKDFAYKKRGDGINYTIEVYFRKYNGSDYWSVVGRSGDYGWGFGETKRFELGKTIRKQIFEPIVSDLM